MPLYEYKCNDCDEMFEVLQKMSDGPLSECRVCHGGNVEKMISTSSFRLKGSGWYITDYKNKSAGSKESVTSTKNSPNQDTNTGNKNATIK
ncbi:MAG: zinc ribbon domain-containing protein [bacterium]|nr:zinc ribbon domain-containing protein [bacterium]